MKNSDKEKKQEKSNWIETAKMEGKTMETKQNQPNDQTRTRCEVYSRVVGYLRPVDQWNEGKQAEFAEREEYVIKPVMSNANASDQITDAND